jgi:hypothetical protein
MQAKELRWMGQPTGSATRNIRFIDAGTAEVRPEKNMLGFRIMFEQVNAYT